MRQKAEREDADSEFCEGRRNPFTDKGNNIFFVGSDM